MVKHVRDKVEMTTRRLTDLAYVVQVLYQSLLFMLVMNSVMNHQVDHPLWFF